MHVESATECRMPQASVFFAKKGVNAATPNARTNLCVYQCIICPSFILSFAALVAACPAACQPNGLECRQQTAVVTVQEKIQRILRTGTYLPKQNDRIILRILMLLFVTASRNFNFKPVMTGNRMRCMRYPR